MKIEIFETKDCARIVYCICTRKKMKPLTVNFKLKSFTVGIATRTKSTHITPEKENCIFYKDGLADYMLFNGIVRWEYDTGITFEI